MGAIRIYCDDPDYPVTWVDVSDRWTLADQRRMMDVEGDDFYTFLRGRVTACHIETVEGDPITDPAQISEAGLGACDVLIIGWLGSVLPLAVAKRRALGNASARLSLPSNAPKLTTATTTTQTAAAQAQN